MPRIVETTVYQLGELSVEAREKARAWFRESMDTDDWYEFVYEDFEAICAILGVRLKTRAVRLYGGGTGQRPCVYFRGFWSQGDGACFDAFYSHAKDAPHRIRAHAPQDGELHRIADALQAVQKRNFYQLHADASHRGYYYHEYCMALSVERDRPTCQGMSADAEEAVTEALRNLTRWLYRQLELEYEYHISDAVVDEAIIANGFTFTNSGRRFG
jgi:hypothetical protein